MPEAARKDDQISHTRAVTGLLTGLAIGAIAAVAIAATVATGGVAGALIAAGVGLAGTAGGGLAGEYIGAAIPSSPTGKINTGSPNVFMGRLRLPAARAVKDLTTCSGLPLIPHGPSPIAQGSTTVFINGMMAARVGDLVTCSAKISSGCSTVIIGGAPGIAPGMTIGPEVPSAVNYLLVGAMIAGTVIGTGGAALASGVPTALASLAGGIIGGAGLGWAGSKIGAEIGSMFGAPELGKRIGEVAGGILGSILGGGIAGRWAAPETPPTSEPPSEAPPTEPSPEPLPTEAPSDPPPTEPSSENPLKPGQAEDIANAFESRFGQPPKGIHVIGSHAEGAAEAGSDIDIAIETDIPDLSKHGGPGFEFFKDVNPGRVPPGVTGIGPKPGEAFIGSDPGEIPKAGTIDPFFRAPGDVRPPAIKVWPPSSLPPSGV